MRDLPVRPGGKILRAAEAESWIDGFAFLEQAWREAEQVIATTQDVVDQARVEGYEAGRRAGETAAAALLVQTSRDVDQYLAGLDRQLADLALSIVRQVLAGFDEANLLATVAAQGLGAFRSAAEVVVRVAPPFAAKVEELLRSHEAPGSQVRVEADPLLSGLQCIVSSPVASIDVGLDAQLGVIRAAMVASA